MNKKNNNLIFFCLIALVYTIFAQKFLCRDFWFDEALTVLNFALLENPLAIYRSYVIPNNQIVHTVLVHFLLNLFPGTDTVYLLRLFEFLLGLGTLAELFYLFKDRMGGKKIWCVPLLALAVSIPFCVYATAVRGYMLSMFFGVAALHFALLSMSSGKAIFPGLYFLFSYLMLGTIPTNLLFSAAILLYVFPCAGEEFRKSRRYWLLCALTAAAFLLFYLPIAPQLYAMRNLHEGWSSGFAVIRAVAAAMTTAFAMLLIPALGSCLAFSRPRYRWRFSSRAMIFLLIPAAALILPTAPFPRVFVVLFPVFALLFGSGLRDLTALNCRLDHRWNGTVFLLALAAAVLLFGAFMARPQTKLAFSRRFGGAGADDFFYGYYLRDSHRPGETAKKLKMLTDLEGTDCYLSFAADPWAFMFHALTVNLPVKRYVFDGPRGPVRELSPGSLVILAENETPEPLEKRFGIKLQFCFACGRNHVYRAR